MAASRDEWKFTQRHHKILNWTGSTVDQALDVFLSNRQQFAVVRDEFGARQVSSPWKMYEKLLGKQIVDELDPVEDMRELARKQALKPRNDH